MDRGCEHGQVGSGRLVGILPPDIQGERPRVIEILGKHPPRSGKTHRTRHRLIAIPFVFRRVVGPVSRANVVGHRLIVKEDIVCACRLGQSQARMAIGILGAHLLHQRLEPAHEARTDVGGVTEQFLPHISHYWTMAGHDGENTGEMIVLAIDLGKAPPVRRDLDTIRGKSCRHSVEFGSHRIARLSTGVDGQGQVGPIVAVKDDLTRHIDRTVIEPEPGSRSRAARAIKGWRMPQQGHIGDPTTVPCPIIARVNADADTELLPGPR